MSLSAAMIDAFLEAGGSVETLAAMVKADLAEAEGRKRRAIPWAALRGMAFQRDGYLCHYCRTVEGPFEIDHVIPRAKGGENTLENVVVACRRCNRSKHDREAPKP